MRHTCKTCISATLISFSHVVFVLSKTKTKIIFATITRCQFHLSLHLFGQMLNVCVPKCFNLRPKTQTGICGRTDAGAGAERTQLEREINLCVPEKERAQLYWLPRNSILIPNQGEGIAKRTENSTCDSVLFYDIFL